MAHGYLALVLHAHLPFVRHPEHARHLEERWFYEALVECYLPLLDAFDRMAEEGVPFALTMSVTPPLAAMMRDDLLRQPLRRAPRPPRSPRGARDEAPLRRRAFRSDRHLLPRPLRPHAQRSGIGTAATSSPASSGTGTPDASSFSRARRRTATCRECSRRAEGIRPQLGLGVAGFERIVGRRPTGAWLAECAYHPSFDAEIARAGIRFTVLDTHGLLHARPRPPFGVHAPVCSPSGVAFFARDAESSRQVWSRDEGYPGDPFYRDFYRDIGFDLPEQDLMGEVAGDGSRLMTGLKYFRITGKDVEKAPVPAGRRARAGVGARRQLRLQSRQAGRGARRIGPMPAPPIVVAPYDAELYGHWWFEGPMFLEAVFRRLREAGGRLEAITLRQYLDRHPVTVEATPSASSWGAGGYGEVWVGREAAWTWRHVHHATRYARWLVQNHRHADGRRGQALDQAIRELLLLQSSDWPFILKAGTATRYAEARIRAHVHRLRHLGYMVESGVVAGTDPAWLEDLCQRDNFLASLAGDELRRWFD